MSILFFEGFETLGPVGSNNDVDDAAFLEKLDLRFTTVFHGDVAFAHGMKLVAGDLGTNRALQLNNSIGSAGNNYVEWDLGSLETAPGAGAAELIIGFRIRVPTGDPYWNPCTFVATGGSGSPAGLTLAFKQSANSDRIEIWNEGDFSPTAQSADGVITPGAWHYIEWEQKQAEAAQGGYSIVRVDGVEVINSSGIDTNRGRTTVNAAVRLRTIQGTDAQLPAYDDIYVIDTNGGGFSTFLGDVRVARLALDGDGTPTDWTPSTGTDNYALVDDDGVDTSDYVDGDANLERDVYTKEAMPTADAVYALRTSAQCRNTTSGSPKINVQIESGVTIVETQGTIDNTSSDKLITHTTQADPDTSASWSKSTVDAATVGIEYEA